MYEALNEGIKQQIRVISHEQYQAEERNPSLTHPVQFVDIGDVIVKGKKEPIRVYAFPDRETTSVPLEYPAQKSQHSHSK